MVKNQVRIVQPQFTHAALLDLCVCENQNTFSKDKMIQDCEEPKFWLRSEIIKKYQGYVNQWVDLAHYTEWIIFIQRYNVDTCWHMLIFVTSHFHSLAAKLFSIYTTQYLDMNLKESKPCKRNTLCIQSTSANYSEFIWCLFENFQGV